MYDANLILNWIELDLGRVEALILANSMGLADWCLAAGFVRNMVWDHIHEYDTPTPLTDIDLIYFDQKNCDESRDIEVEVQLKQLTNLPWSVKNQARMHIRNSDEPYTSTSDAMSYWVELETAVGVRIGTSGKMELIAPFGVEYLFGKSITINPKRPKYNTFENRIRSKKWLQIWPKLTPTTLMEKGHN